MDSNLNKRFWEIDVLRGIAIIMMIIFHVLFDLNFFGIYEVEVFSGFWWWFARITAISFLLLVGVSITLSFSRLIKVKKSGKFFSKYLKRGLIIFSFGLLITLFTRIFLGKGFVIFGILHLIGISIILVYPFLKFRYFNLFLALLVIFAGIYLQQFTFNFDWLLWLGFVPHSFYSVDYFPVFPWFGVVLMGVFFGNLLYPNYIRKFNIKDRSNFSFIKMFSFLGKKSLIIYLVHQPIILLVFYISGLA